jgi:hypothetical protein
MTDGPLIGLISIAIVPEWRSQYQMIDGLLRYQTELGATFRDNVASVISLGLVGPLAMGQKARKCVA